MILYFSGTGNSAYVAKQLSELTGDQCLSINRRLHDNNTQSIKSQKPVVFVFPVHDGRMPRAVKTFIESTKFTGNNIAYFVATYSTDISALVDYTLKLCKKKGFRFHGLETVKMPESDIVRRPLTPQAEAKELIAAAGEKIQKIAHYILSGEMFHYEAAQSKGLSVVLNPIRALAFSPKKFHVTDKCNGCGECAVHCPMNNITITDKKPTWGNHCAHCMICVNRCPSIEYSEKTKGKGRYKFSKEWQ